MGRSSARRTALLTFALVTMAGPPPARAQEQNHPGLAVEWMAATQGRCERIALGDLDGDGDPDLVVGNASSGSWSLWWNDGRAGFDERTELPRSGPIGSLLVFDADRDGIDDILAGVPEPNGGVYLIRGLGGRRFAGGVGTAIGLPSSRRLIAADMNGDGRLDIVGLSDGADRTVGVAINQGGGAFVAASAAANGIAGRALAVADFDGDGHPDVACAPVTDAICGVRVLRGDGAGGLAPLAEFERLFADGPRELLPVDLDGDGDADLLSADHNGKLGIHFNDGAGGFTGIEHGVSSSEFGIGIALAQLDRDEAPEVIVTSAQRTRGGPHFDVHQAGEDPLLERGRFHSYYHFHERESAPNQVCAGDLDGDGWEDLVLLTSMTSPPDARGCPAPDGNSRIGVVRSRPNGALGAITFHPAAPMRRLRLARFARGPAEMVLSGGDGIHRARLDESGALETPKRIADGLDAWPVDANGDGHDDLVVAATADTLALRLTHRDGEVGPEVARWAGRWVAGGDLGGHPGEEIVFLAPDGRVRIAWSHAGQPAVRVTATDIPGPAGRIVVANTGSPHMRLTRLAPGSTDFYSETPRADTAIVYLVLPNGLVHEAARSPIALPAYDSYFFKEIVAADLDGRFGDELLVLRTAFGGRLEVLSSLGEGRFSAIADVYSLRPEEPRSLVAEDLDGDGRRDVCWVVQEEASVSRLHVLWNYGAGRLGDLWTRYLARSGVGSIAAGDVDRDGVTDLAMAGFMWNAPNPDAVGVLYGAGPRKSRSLRVPRNAQVLAAEATDIGLQLRSVRPNPVRGSVVVALTLSRREPATLELYDLAGRRAMVEHLAHAEPGEQTLQLRLPPALRAGIYWLALRQGDSVSSKRLTVMR